MKAKASKAINNQDERERIQNTIDTLEMQKKEHEDFIAKTIKGLLGKNLLPYQVSFFENLYGNANHFLHYKRDVVEGEIQKVIKDMQDTIEDLKRIANLGFVVLPATDKMILNMKAKQNRLDGHVDISLNIKLGLYDSQFPYPNKKDFKDEADYREAKEQYNESANQGYSNFKRDCFEYYGIQDNPKKELVWEKAWSRGHANGLYDVFSELAELIDLIK